MGHAADQRNFWFFVRGEVRIGRERECVYGESAADVDDW